jgi:hypothetical protein
VRDRARRIEAELQALAAELARKRFGARDWAGDLELPLTLEPDGQGEWRVAGGGLLDTLDHALRESAAVASPYRSGRVYCFRCETAGCGHAAPDAPNEVFAGYGQTGLPLWEDFAQALLADGHDGVEHLYEGGRRLVARFEDGEALKSRQLAAFGKDSKTHDVLGQVAAGWFHVNGRDERLALSLLAVEHRGPQGEVQLDLNIVGRPTAHGDLAHVLGGILDERHASAIRGARSALKGLQERLRSKPARKQPAVRDEILGRVPFLLRKLERNLGATERRRVRRTGHAEERRKQQRPVQSALREALKARPETTLVDEHEGTLVVLGKRNRVHVFSPEGRHVTSLSLEPDAVDRRIRRERWRPATQEEAEALQGRLRRASGER